MRVTMRVTVRVMRVYYAGEFLQVKALLMSRRKQH